MSTPRQPETAAQQTPPVARRRSAGRMVRIALIVAAVAAALAAAGPDALDPFRDAAGAATEVTVAFVLDFGGSSGAEVGCVNVPSTDNGYDALTAFTAEGHLAAPTYNSANLLCSINNVPTSGCGQVVSGGYIYWSYWIGSTGTWAYANSGAFATVKDGDVYGWKFQNPGKGNPSDPPPGVSPAQARSICATTTTTTTTTPTTQPSVTTTTIARSTPGTTPANPSSPGSSAPVTTAVPVGIPTSPAPTKAGAPSAPCTTTTIHPVATTTTTAGTGPATSKKTPCTTPAPSGTSTTPEHIAVVSAGGTTAGKDPGDPTAGGAGNGQQALRATATDSHPDGGSSAAPLIIGGLLIAALFVAAAFRWRRRPGTS